jgi:hypothetical protein
MSRRKTRTNTRLGYLKACNISFRQLQKAKKTKDPEKIASALANHTSNRAKLSSK